MATKRIVWNERLKEVWDKTYYSLDYNIHKTTTQQEEFRINMILNDPSLMKNEKKFLVRELQMLCSRSRVGDSSVKKQHCNNCQNWYQAILYCEMCIRKYLESNFGNWTSGNDEIDKLI